MNREHVAEFLYVNGSQALWMHRYHPLLKFLRRPTVTTFYLINYLSPAMVSPMNPPTPNVIEITIFAATTKDSLKGTQRTTSSTYEVTSSAVQPALPQ